MSTLTPPPARSTPHGLMLVLSAPSGTGKTTISRALRARNPYIGLSISATTRPPRPGEEHGVHYFFTDKNTFQAMAAAGELLEYAAVYQHDYGTPLKPVEQALEKGHDVLFDIDWQGMQQIKLLARKDMVSVFILPPSIEELRRRLDSRAGDSEEVIQYRMNQALADISHWAEYDYVFVNDDIDQSVAHLEAILRAEKLRRNRQPHLPAFVRSLKPLTL
jgi:guanylate kinase